MEILILLLVILNTLALIYLIRSGRILGTKISKLQSKTVTRAEVEKEVSTAEKRNFRQVESYLQLQQWLNLREPLPSTRGFAASPDFLLEISRVMRKERPSLIVELGSGISTLVMAKQLGRKSKLISIDHSRDYAEATEEILSQNKVKGVKIIVAELDPQTNWYSLEKLKGINGIDLLVIDGPPQSVGVDARHPATFFIEKLNSGATVMIDDTKRESEERLAHTFSKRLPNYTLRFLDHEKGTALLQPKN
jgi:predicted O-methyltransferase YrrM